MCLINASAVGTEILKNLVLPGFGSFTIIDGKITDGADAGSNFFLERSSIGLPRGRVATELLKELNEDVTGHFVEEVIEPLGPSPFELTRALNCLSQPPFLFSIVSLKKGCTSFD